jgi:hypothetical protein
VKTVKLYWYERDKADDIHTNQQIGARFHPAFANCKQFKEKGPSDPIVKCTMEIPQSDLLDKLKHLKSWGIVGSYQRLKRKKVVKAKRCKCK